MHKTDIVKALVFETAVDSKGEMSLITFTKS